MASSSTPTAAQPARYDVYLSFRGEDTRNNFTSHLYAALTRQRISTFTDYRLERGEDIWQSLWNIIEESHIYVIIFSQNYASSKWCLDELVKILQCQDSYRRTVIPVFYHVHPSDVRRQTGTFGQAFAKHEARSTPEKVQIWRTALTKAADFSGFDANVTRPEAALVDAIVEAITRRLITMSQSDEGFVGLESRVNGIVEFLCTHSKDVLMIGIWGMGGIGKTTLAKAIYHKIFAGFDSSCFINNVREESEEGGGLTFLKRKLLSSIKVDEFLDRSTVDSVLIETKERPGRKKVLVVLDDVTHSTQIDFFIRGLDCIAPGSLIIITTRDKLVLLNSKVDKIIEVNGLSHDEALVLFSRYAFKGNYPAEGYLELSESIVEYTKGLPLALKFLGSYLFGREKEQWESALHRLQSKLPREIYEVLKISYDGLDDEERAMFRDIASSFRGQDIDSVIQTCRARGYSAEVGMRELIDKSLITVTNDATITMHDLVQEMAREIVRQERSQQ